MASTFSDLGIELMATGENAGTWGTKTNTNLQIIEKSIAGYVEQAVTSGGTTALSITDGDATESTSVARHAVIKLTGTISGNSIVTVPDSIEKVYIVTNGTSGAYTVQFKTASGTGITFGTTEKTTRLVYSDGTNLVDAGFGGSLDMEGRELVLDADGDTTITADTDDQIDIKIAGADDFQFTANTFTAQAGSTIAAQALTATTITASGIVKTDDTTEATSTTDGSLQTDGGLSVAKDAVLGDDLKLLSDSAVLSFGADSDTTLTHTDGTGLTLNSTNKLLFRDTGLYINSSTDGQLDIVADTEIQIAATTIDINGAIAMDGAITGATNITLSGELDAATLDISGNADIDGTLEADAITINGTAIGSIYGAVAGSSSIVTTGALDSGSITSGFGNIDTGSSTITTTGLITGGSLDIDDVLINGTTIGHTDDTDLITLADGVATVAGEISVTTLDIGGTNVTATAAEINLIDGGTARGTTAVADGDGLLVNDGGTMRMTNVTTLKTYFQSGVTASGIAADDISTGDGAVTLATSSGNITIDATANDTDIIFKGTDATADITMLTLDGSDAGSATFNHDIILGNDSFVRFGDAGEKITGDGTDLTIDSSNDLHLTATTDINVPQNVGMTFGDDGEKIEGDGTDLTIASSAKLNLTATSDIHIPNNVGIIFGGDSEKIEGDGTDLTISANNLTIDAAADIILDAAGNDFNFKAGGTEVLRISNSSSDVIIKPIVDTKDIIFQQRDGTEVARIEDNATFNVVTDKLAINGTAITSTAAEINKLDGVGTLKEAGKETIWVPAVAMYPNSTNGCADLAQTELSNGPEIKTLDFDKDSDEFAQFAVAFPKSWNEGTVTFQAFFTANTTNTGTTAWGLAGVALADDGALNTAFGTTVVATAKAMSGTANDLAVTAESGAVTIAGSPSTDEYVFFQIQRDVSADGLTADAKLLGIKLFFTTDAKNDA